MPIRKDDVTDGITTESRSPGRPLHVAEVRAFVERYSRLEARFRTFDGRVKPLEQFCRKLVRQWVARQPRIPTNVWQATQPVLPAAGNEFGAPEWYAREILSAIDEVRSALAKNEAERATSKAVVVGILAAEAEAKHNWKIVQSGKARRREKRKSALGRGKAISKAASQEDVKTRRLVEDYKASDQIETSLVSYVAQRLGRHKQTIQRRFKRLGIPPS
jgi:hypothetical protein